MRRTILHPLAVDPDLAAVAQALPVLLASADHQSHPIAQEEILHRVD